MRLLAFVFGSLLFLSGCNMPDIQKQTSSRFTDQYFKTSIALVELYKIRHGYYPARLDSLDYLGDWDKMIFSFVEYQRLDSGGYRLDVKRGPMNARPEDVSFPAGFWRGIGLRRTNVPRSAP